ncbi:MAG: DUF541 domain-containing protein [Micromonosporaceae bacterium]|nr:DUF541 domain-containing protein [Micromonosporaceae bacterium]
MSESENSALTGVVVTGTGRVSLPPDVLTARLGAEATTTGVQEALDRCSVAMTALAAALREGAVADRDRRTSGSTLHQAHDHTGQPRGWTAVQELTVRLRDLDRAGELISAAIAAAGDEARLHAVAFDIDRDSDEYAAARVQARQRAFADAHAAATQYAELAGRRLGVVITMREVNGGYPPPYPMRMAAMEAMPVEQGELDVTTTVEVRWELLS